MRLDEHDAATALVADDGLRRAPPPASEAARPPGAEGIDARARAASSDAIALPFDRAPTALVEELVDGPEVTVNAFSVGGEFFPLTVTDRLTADHPPAWRSRTPGRATCPTGRTQSMSCAPLPRRSALRTARRTRRSASGRRPVMESRSSAAARTTSSTLLGYDLNRPRARSAAIRTWRPRGPTRPAAPAFASRPARGRARSRGRARGGIPGRGGRPRLPPARPSFERGADRPGFVLATGDSKADALVRADRAAALVRFETADVEARVQA